ncbi:MAG TPA: hypothetical protein VGF31_04155, partial [Myxococcaceae bacterium]
VSENQLVQAPDGSLYVFENGQLHAIEPVSVTVPQLLGMPVGSDVTAGVTIIPSGTSEAPVAAEPAPPANPVAGLVGQRAMYCYQNNNVAIEVVRAEWTRQVGSQTAPREATWLVLLFDATPQSRLGPAFNDQFGGLEVRDEQGRTFRPASDFVSSTAAETFGGTSNTSGGIAPGTATRLIRTFEAASDAQSITFVGGRVNCD